LLVDHPGEHRFWLASDDGSSLTIDDALVVGPGDPRALALRRGTAVLERGPHSIRVEFQDGSGDAEVHLAWQPPGAAPTIVPVSALRTPSGTPGLLGQYGAPVVDLGIRPESALVRLRADHIRFVIVDGQRKAVATALRLHPTLQAYGLAIYEVPTR
jgi:hypothetical protein